MPYKIRFASLSECAELPELERVAARVFLPYLDVTGLTAELLEQTNSEADYRSAQSERLLWVIADSTDRPVGFAMLRRLGAGLHLQEIDVHPDHARRGLGGALIKHVCSELRANDVKTLSLTTYRYVPWNAAFYERFGFRILDEPEMPAALRDLRHQEATKGWPLWARVAMQKDLATTVARPENDRL